MRAFSVIANAVKGYPAIYVPIKRFVTPLVQAARHLTVRFATFVLAQQPLTRFLLTPVRMDSVANLEAKGELGGESINVRTIFPDEPLFDQLPTRIDGEQHWNLREYRSAAGKVATISHGRFWLPGLAVTSGNRTYLHDVLFKLSVHAPQNAIRAIPFTRALVLPGVIGLIAGNRPETYFHWMVEVAPRQVENEDEVIACLEPYGFQVVTLSGLSVAAQAALFGSARAVAGPHGAGFANLLFCKPGTLVLEFFSPLYVNFCFWILARGADLPYFYILGEGPDVPDSVQPSLGSGSIRVPIPVLRRAVDKSLHKPMKPAPSIG